jgi:arylsulfatase A-like enzyme
MRRARLRNRFLGITALAIAASAQAAPAEIRSICGSVTGLDGRPLAGVNLLLEDAMRSTASAKDGSFCLDDVQPGSHAVVASAFAMATERVAVEVPGQGAVPPVAIKLGPNQKMAAAAAAFREPQMEHLAQKQAYLASIARAPRGKRPNIVVILFDDLGYGDLGSYGNRLIKTPNIDAMARKGALLSDFYSSSPVCSPSRAGMMTGRYPTRSHTEHHVAFPTGSLIAQFRSASGFANGITPDEILLPEILRANGYRTQMVGKWHLGDRDGQRPTDLGFDHWFGTLYSNDMNPLDLWRDRTIDTPAAQVQQGTLTQRFGDEAVRFIESKPADPFFLYVPFTAPHAPLVANPATAGRSEAGVYGDLVEDLDTAVGRIVAALEAKGAARDTILIVTSDNGAADRGSSGALRGRKGETFEGGMRVPFLIVWPGKVPAGVRRSGMAMNIDILPTIMADLGLPLPADRAIDGRDIGPMLATNADSPHRHLFYLNQWNGNFEAVRNADYKYRGRIVGPSDRPLHLAVMSAPTPGPPGLFDLDRDAEAHDLSGRYPAVAKELADALAAVEAERQTNPRGWRP